MTALIENGTELELYNKNSFVFTSSFNEIIVDYYDSVSQYRVICDDVYTFWVDEVIEMW